MIRMERNPHCWRVSHCEPYLVINSRQKNPAFQRGSPRKMGIVSECN
ncbi:Uncharacterised protein [Vibrio cholerae]|nr:Uncharacterised protein [Vibrio cholerae]